MTLIRQEVIHDYHLELYEVDQDGRRSLMRFLALYRTGRRASPGDAMLRKLRFFLRESGQYVVEDNHDQYHVICETLDDANVTFDSIRGEIDYKYDEYLRLIEGLDFFHTFRPGLLTVRATLMGLTVERHGPWPSVIRFATREEYDEFTKVLSR